MSYSVSVNGLSPRKQPSSKKVFYLKLGIIFFVVDAIVLITIAFFLSQPRTTNLTQDSGAYTAISSVLGQNAVLPNGKSVTSSLGFSATYDEASIKARAQTTDENSTENNPFGIEYEGDELTETRPYSMFIFELKKGEQENDLGLLAPRLSVLTNIRASFFPNRESQAQYAGKSKIDILVEDTVQNRLKNTPNTTASEPIDIVINNVAYKKVVLTTTYTFLGEISYSNTQDIYMTVQNGRPYWAQITQVTQQSEDQVPILESIIASVTYPAPETAAPTQETFTPASANILTLPVGSSYVPQPLDEDTLINVVAKNQPAVVRVGTVKCIDGSLTGGTGFTFENACGAGIGSGSIVSSDGYIATNGHVTRMKNADVIGELPASLYIAERDEGSFPKLRSFLQYLASIGKINGGAIDSYIAALRQQDKSALGSLFELTSYIPSNAITAAETRYTYAIQTSNEPLRMPLTEGEPLAFTYSSTILKASHIDSNYDENLSFNESYDQRSDVSILKIDGVSNFPIVTFGSIDTLAAGSQLTAIGFPAFVDGGTQTKQEKTVPAITQGDVLEIGTSSSNYKLIRTTVPVAQGNSGGPAFDDGGNQIGLNTYSQLTCPDKQCFGDGTARDIADFQELLKKNNITLNTNSATSRTWNEALDALSSAHYTRAASQFASVANSYPANYLATSLSELATSRIGGPDDRSGQADLANVLVIVAIVLAAAAVTITVIVIVIRRKHRRSDNTLPPQPPITPTAPAPPVPPTPPPSTPTPPVASVTPVSTPPTPPPVSTTPSAAPTQTAEAPANPWFTNQPPRQ